MTRGLGSLEDWKFRCTFWSLDYCCLKALTDEIWRLRAFMDWRDSRNVIYEFEYGRRTGPVESVCKSRDLFDFCLYLKY